MLVISRKVGEIVDIDVDGKVFSVVIVDIDRNKCRIGFDAPKEVKILRRELSNEGIKNNLSL